jgi:hypothetical protein
MLTTRDLRCWKTVVPPRASKYQRAARYRPLIHRTRQPRRPTATCRTDRRLRLSRTPLLPACTTTRSRLSRMPGLRRR